MRPTTVPLFYLWRIRAHPLRELLAAIGIATGVALVFAVQVANSSITGSVTQLVHGITGSFSLQIAARDATGFDSGRLLPLVRSVNGVRTAAPVLEQRVQLTGTKATASVDLVGATAALAAAGGPLVDGFGGPFGPRLTSALLLPQPLADRIGARAGSRIKLAGRLPFTIPVPVSALLGGAQIGTAIDSPLAVAPLDYVQVLAGLPGRATRILIATKPGAETRVRDALARLVGDSMTVGPSDAEIGYVEQAAGPNNQSTGLFAAICAVVGVLFTFNAMLLTVPERRRMIADLRREGLTRSRALLLLLAEALVLGVVASAIGLLLGDQISRTLFKTSPGYLSFAFPVGGQRIVPVSSLLIAPSCGLAATLIATTPLLRDVLARRPFDAVYRDHYEPGEGIGAPTRTGLAVLGVLLVAATIALVLAVPATTIVGVGLLAVAMLAVVPAALVAALRLIDPLPDRVRGSALAVAIMELNGSVMRATALAATGALAVLGVVAIQGARGDLLRGLDSTQASLLGTADAWITAPGDANILMTTPFSAPSLARLRSLPAVATVRPFRGTFLDMDGRRLWLMARPPDDRELIPPTQIERGQLATATRHIRAGGWVAVSAPVADHRGLRIGDQLALPTPSGSRTVRVAAIVSNLGWAPGAIVMNGRDYRRWWPSNDVTGLEVDFRPGIAPAAGKATLVRALGPSSLQVEIRGERVARFGRLERQGLNRLKQIATLLLIASVLAMSAAMWGAVWQQRGRIAALRADGASIAKVLRLLLTQAAVVLLTGTAIGAAFGLAAQALGTRWLHRTTSFPATFDIAVPFALGTLALVVSASLAVVAIPGWFAARTEPQLALRGE